MPAARALVITMLLFGINPVRADAPPRLQIYMEILREYGRPPLEFVVDKLDDVDLIVFDDAWHPCAEPWGFYSEMVRSPDFRAKAKWIFVEAFPINQQTHIDAYLASDPEDVTLLYPVFQNDLSGTGWPLASYFDFMHAVWEVNQGVDESERLHVIAVNAPTYWPEIETPEDVALFRRSLMGNDYTMYRVIADVMGGFMLERKGVYLTNTRHAYKGIRDTEGRLFWDAGTFLHQRHPGRTCSIRFHNMALSIEGERDLGEDTPRTTAGQERLIYSWVRMGDGIWDSAFAAMGNKPVAFPLAGNVFGAHPYVGNHMHKAAPGQTMEDANDAVIFLAPLEELHNTATVDFIYTPEFKKELERRYGFLYTSEQLEAMMAAADVSSLGALIDHDCAASPRELIPQARTLPPMDAWREQAESGR
jgi:hypothetical protein